MRIDAARRQTCQSGCLVDLGRRQLHVAKLDGRHAGYLAVRGRGSRAGIAGIVGRILEEDIALRRIIEIHRAHGDEVVTTVAPAAARPASTYARRTDA